MTQVVTDNPEARYAAESPCMQPLQLQQNPKQENVRQMVPVSSPEAKNLYEEQCGKIYLQDQTSESKVCILHISDKEESFSWEGSHEESSTTKSNRMPPSVVKVLYKHKSSPLGKGAFGFVYRAKAKFPDDKAEMDICIKQSKYDNSGLDHTLHTEWEIYEKIKGSENPYLLKCYGLFADVDRYSCYLLLEYFDGQNLARCFQGKRATPTDVLEILLALIKGILCLHHNKIWHFDIKPDNILYNERTVNYKDGQTKIVERRLKLIDFGLSRIVIGSDTVSVKSVGTPNYMAPEILFGTNTPTFACDVYSAGATAFYLMTSHHPWHDLISLEHNKKLSHHQLIESIKEEMNSKTNPLLERLTVNASWKEVKTIVENMLNLDPYQRPDLSIMREKLERLIFVPDPLQSENIPVTASGLCDSGIQQAAQQAGASRDGEADNRQ